MSLFASHENPDQRFHVYVKLERVGGYVNYWPMTREEAEKRAEKERALPYVTEVRIEEATEVLGGGKVKP